MRLTPEEELDRWIDALNRERRPRPAADPEAAELLAVVRTVRTLRPAAEPSPHLGRRLAGVIRGGHGRARTPVRVAALVAGLLLLVLLAPRRPGPEGDVVLALERAVARLAGYHGILEQRTINGAGEEWLVRRDEIWSEGGKYATRDDQGTLTVNNGERRWQVRPLERRVILLPLIPDPRRGALDLREEARRARRHPHAVTGREVVAGREAVRLTVSPPGGLPYDLWIDARTHYPVQLRTAMQNGLQTLYTFVRFEADAPIDPALFAFRPPEGFQVIADDPGEQVATLREAAAVAGFEPLPPARAPARILAFRDRIALDYGDTTVIQTPARGSFEPARHGAIGRAGGGPLEIVGDRLRWRQAGVEIRIEGPQRVALARRIAPDLALPDPKEDLAADAQITVPVDMGVAENDQRGVDAGHSPWQLDPVQVAMTFVNLRLSPGGIRGEPAVGSASFTLLADTGVQAVVAVDRGPVARVYLKRLVRQDETGIWSVTGYDPR